jgi:hypothetical protein
MPGRRLIVALLLVTFPACLHVGPPPAAAPDEVKDTKDAKPIAPIEPAPPRLEFASLPRVPGTVVLTRPAPTPTAAPNQQAINPPLRPGDPQPIGPVSPVAHLGEPNAFPVPPTQPVGPALESPLLAAVRAYAENRPERAGELLRTLDKPNQEFVLALLPVLANGAGADLNNPATAAALVDQLHALGTRLEPRAALRIEKVAFCDDVAGFGRFVPRPPGATYRPNGRAQFYLEVRNLTSEPAGDEFLTYVHATVEVRDAHKELVEQIDPDDYRRRVRVVRYERRLPSRSPLHDFHILYIFSAPPAPGVYTITIELRDPTGRRAVKTAPVEFCVAQ